MSNKINNLFPSFRAILGNTSLKANKAAESKANVSLIDADVVEESRRSVQFKQGARKAGFISLGVVAGGAITAATYGLVQAAPHIGAAAHTFFSNPHLVPALIGVAAGVGAVLVAIAVYKAVQGIKAYRLEAREKAEFERTYNQGWNSSRDPVDGASEAGAPTVSDAAVLV